MKRIIALVLCMFLVFGLPGVSALALDTDRIADQLLEYTADERLNIMTILVSLVSQNSGLDMAQELILEYDPDSDLVYDKFMKRIFAKVDQQTALNAIAQMYKIDEGLRNKYFYGLLDRVELPLSVSTQQILQRFFEEEILSKESLAVICEEDGITVPVIAHFCRFFVELNRKAPLLTDADETDFAVGTVSYLLDDLAWNLSEYKISFTQGMQQLSAKLNARYDADEKAALKKALREIGWYAPALSYAGTGMVGGNVTKEPLSQADGFGYRVVSRSATEGDIIEVAYYESGKAISDKVLTEPLKIAIPVDAENVMICYAGESEERVKYTFYADGVLYCRLDKAGTYKIYEVEPYFADADGWGKAYIEALFRRGIISGKSAGVFEPEAQITREEFVKLAVELFNLTDKTLGCDFADVAPDAWYAPYIASAKQHGIVNGISETRFGVGAPITRQDMCKILYGMLVKMELTAGAGDAQLTFHDAAQIASYATEPVRMLVGLGIISGDDLGNFNPQNNATRQEAAKLIYGMLSLYVR